MKVAQLCWILGTHGLSQWNFPGQNTGVDCLSLLLGIFPTKGLNPGLPHYRWILYQLSHKRSPRILKWVAYPFSRGSSWPRNQNRVSCIAGGFFTNWAIRNIVLFLVTKSCLTLWNSIGCSPPGSMGILYDCSHPRVSRIGHTEPSGIF